MTDPRMNAGSQEQLLAEGRALRALARGLLGGDGDDAVQEGFAAALAQPGAARQPGPWLMGTVRRLAAMWRRTDARRRAREQAAARSDVDADSDPAAIAADAEIAEVVAHAVRELDEPFRTAIVLRYWRGLSPEQIAAELGVPRNTVRSRLQRGLERLRTRLDAQAGGRAQWCGALATFAGAKETSATAAAIGGPLALAGLLMNTKILMGAAVLVAAALVFPMMWPDAPGSTTHASTEPTPTPALAARAAAGAAHEPELADRELDLAPTAPAPAATPADAPFDPSPVVVTPWVARLLVVDANDAPIEGATVTIHAATRRDPRQFQFLELSGSQAVYSYSENPTRAPLLELRTDRSGHASATVEHEGVFAAASQGGMRIVSNLLWHTRANTDVTRIVFQTPIVLRGRVVRADGSPAAGATVTATPGGGSGAMRRGPPIRPDPATADAEGRFQLPVTHYSGYSLGATLEGERTFGEVRIITTKTPPEVVLVFPGGISLRGQVVDANGEPVARANVNVWREYRLGDPQQDPDDYERVYDATTDGDGRFRIDVRRHARYELIASRSGHANSAATWLEPTAVRPHAEATLALQRFATIRGVVLRGDRKPFAGIQVGAQPPGTQTDATAVSSLRDHFQTVTPATTDAEGRFTLTVHPGTPWTITAYPLPNDIRHRVDRENIAPGTTDLIITVPDDALAGCIVRGEVTANGAPLTSYSVQLLSPGANGHWRMEPVDAKVDGHRFELPPLPLGQTRAVVITPLDPPESRGAPGAGTFAPVCSDPFTTPAAGVELRLNALAWGELPVLVVAADGTAARDVYAIAWREPQVTGWFTNPARVERDGRIVLKHLAPGLHALTITNDTGKLHEQHVTVAPGLNPEVVARLPR